MKIDGWINHRRQAAMSRENRRKNAANERDEKNLMKSN
jgi:hypothetical protein